jgi:hypothetical protein
MTINVLSRTAHAVILASLVFTMGIAIFAI